MRCLLLLLLMPSAVSMRARVPPNPTAKTREPPPNAHSLLDASTYNVAQAADVPKWLVALVGALAMMGQKEWSEAYAAQNHGLVHPGEGALHNAGLMYNVEMLHKMKPSTGSPAHKANVKDWEEIAQLSDAQQTEAIKYGGYQQRVDPPKYTPTKEGPELNDNFFLAFEAMADEVVHNDQVTYSKTATPAEMEAVTASVVASMDQVDKFLSFLEEPESEGHKEFFQKDWSKRATGSRERKERQTQVQFVVNVLENTLAHFSDAKNMRAAPGGFMVGLDSQLKAMNSLRNLRKFVEFVLVDDHLNPTGYKQIGGPETDILAKIDKLLVPKKHRISTFADDAKKRADLRLAKVVNEVVNK